MRDVYLLHHHFGLERDPNDCVQQLLEAHRGCGYFVQDDRDLCAFVLRYHVRSPQPGASLRVQTDETLVSSPMSRQSLSKRSVLPPLATALEALALLLLQRARGALPLRRPRRLVAAGGWGY